MSSRLCYNGVKKNGKGLSLAMEKHGFEILVVEAVGLTLEEALARFDWDGYFPIVEKKSNVVVSVAYADSPEFYSLLEFAEDKEAYFV